MLCWWLRSGQHVIAMEAPEYFLCCVKWAGPVCQVSLPALAHRPSQALLAAVLSCPECLHLASLLLTRMLWDTCSHLTWRCCAKGTRQREMRLHHLSISQEQSAPSAWTGQVSAYTVNSYTLTCTAFVKVNRRLIPDAIPKTQQDSQQEDYTSNIQNSCKFIQLSHNFGSNLYWHKNGPESKLFFIPTSETACLAISTWV